MKKIKKIPILIIIFFSGFLSCEKNSENIDYLLDKLPADKYYASEIFDGSNLDIYGKWRLFNVSGGIHGGGHELSFDYLEVHKYGIYGFIRNGRILEFGKINIEEQGSEGLLITFKPDDDSEVFMYDSEKIVNLSGNDTLNLDSPCCDRYNYHFTRIY